MKTYNKPATSKLVARFDNELMNLLMEDLRSFREKTQFTSSNKQNAAQQQLSAAWSLYILYIYLHITFEKNKARLNKAEPYFFAAYFTMRAAVFADAPGVPIFSSNRS